MALWLLVPFILLIGTPPVVISARRLRDETAATLETLEAIRTTMRPAVQELAVDADRLRSGLSRLRRPRAG